jgi:hypothetical protein
MKIYKINFANNQPISWKELTEGVVFEGSYHYVHTDGRLIYAVVKAETEVEVLKRCALIIQEIKEKYSIAVN